MVALRSSSLQGVGWVEGPTWTHLWLGEEPQSGSAGTGGDILAISALSLRGTQWHPGGRGRNRGLSDAANLSSTPAPHTLGFLIFQGPQSPKLYQSLASLREGENKLPPQRAPGKCFHIFIPPRGLVHSLMGSSAQQMSTDLKLLRVSGAGGGERVASRSHLTSPSTEIPRASSFVIAMGSFPWAHQPAYKLLTLSTILAGELQAQSGRGTQ